MASFIAYRHRNRGNASDMPAEPAETRADRSRVPGRLRRRSRTTAPIEFLAAQRSSAGRIARPKVTKGFAVPIPGQVTDAYVR